MAARGVLADTGNAVVDLVGVIGAQVLAQLMPRRRSRSNPRVVKCAISVYAANTARGRIRAPSQAVTTTIKIVHDDPRHDRPRANYTALALGCVPWIM